MWNTVFPFAPMSDKIVGILDDLGLAEDTMVSFAICEAFGEDAEEYQMPIGNFAGIETRALCTVPGVEFAAYFKVGGLVRDALNIVDTKMQEQFFVVKIVFPLVDEGTNAVIVTLESTLSIQITDNIRTSTTRLRFHTEELFFELEIGIYVKFDNNPELQFVLVGRINLKRQQFEVEGYMKGMVR